MPEQLDRVCLACNWAARTRRLVCHCGQKLIRASERLKVCRTCDSEFDAGSNARASKRCAACIAKDPKVPYLKRTCVKCGWEKRGNFTVCPCGGKMLSVSERTRHCPRCETSFMAWGRQVYCDECTDPETLRKRAYRDALKAGQPTAKGAIIPCATCKHGASSTIADSGWLCRIERAGGCRPYSVALYYQKETTIV